MKENYSKFPLLLLLIAVINVSSFANISSIAVNTGIIPTASVCSTPASQPTSLTFIAPISTIAWGSFTATTADEYLVLVSTSATLTAAPISGTTYSVGNTIGNARVVSIGPSTIFAAFGLNPSTTYHFSVFALNSIGCTDGPAYLTPNPLSGSETTKALPIDIPTAQPTSLVFGSATATTISGSFTSASATGYLVLRSSSPELTATPIDKNDYVAGAIIGNATVISSGATTTFSATGLSSSTPYYISVFSYYADPSCSCGRIYRTIAPLTGSTSTLEPACTTPLAQPSALVFDTPTSTSISGSFTAASADEYLVVYSTSASLSATPVNGTSYNSGVALGNATVLSRSSSTSFSASGLSSSTTYYFYVFSLNNMACSAGPAYKTSAPLSDSSATLPPPCVAPANSPTTLVFATPTSNTISGSYTATTADSYLILYSTSATLTSSPVIGTTYTAGNTLGNATVLSNDASTSFAASGLSVSTTYYITVFPYNNSACNAGPAYKTSTPLSGSFATLAAPCVAPSNSPTALVFDAPTSSTVSGSFTANSASGYLIVYSTSASLTSSPTNGTIYTAGNTIGNATVLSSSTSTSFSASSLNVSTTYYITVFPYNNTACSAGPAYKTSTPLLGNVATLATPCVAPANSPTALVFDSPTSTTISGSFTANSASGYLIVYSTSASLSSSPTNGTIYTAGNTLGNATVLSSGTSTTFSASSLSVSTTYYITVFAFNNTACSAGPVYKSSAPLSGSVATLAAPCVAPGNSPTALNFDAPTSSTISGSFTASSANGYLVVYSTAASLSSTPVNGTSYTAGNTLGNASVLSSGSSTNFSASGLSVSTTYYITVFPFNNTACSAGPAYKTTAPLSDNIATLATPCVAPSNSPTALVFGTSTSSTISGSFTASSASGYLVVYSTAASLSSTPVNGTSYTAGNTLGNATVLSSGSSTSFSASGLSVSTTYYITVFPFNNTACSAGPAYKTSTPLSDNIATLATPCVAPSNSPTALVFGTSTSSTISGSFTASSASGYLVVYSTAASLSSTPVNGTSYTAGNTLGNATVLSSGSSTSFSASGLSVSTTYYITVFPYNNTACSAGPAYKTTAALSDNIATLATPCVAPSNSPTALVFGTSTSSTISGSFTASSASGYLVVYSTSASLSSSPVNGTSYTAGNAIGNATVLSSGSSTSFSASGLSVSTTYYVTVFAFNNSACSAGPVYKTTSPLSGSAATLATPCVAPSNSPTALVFGTPTSSTVSGSFTASSASGYLIVYSTSASLSASPANGTAYIAGNTLGNGTVLTSGSSTSFSASGLNASTTYYFSVFAYNNLSCSGGPVYKTTSPLAGSAATLAPACVAPSSSPTALVFGTPTSSTITGSFTATSASGYLVVYSTSSSLSASPSNATAYTAGNTLGNATVLSSGSSTSFSASGLSVSTTYYFTVFAYNNSSCSGGPVYKTTSPLTGNIATSSETLNFYFGNFHSHSEYSDGTGLPSGDFAYGDAASCMDFLGISEHNHVAAGMSLANWSLGRSQATAATTSTFLALYGMEWGVISTGGHVIVYGVPNLLGWDPGQYQTYVPQTEYIGNTGLFKVITSFGSNAFATLAHPNNSDFDNIMTTYDADADAAIVGSAVENGPSTSTNTTYSDPPTSMADLSYYRNMLARGYHLGPTIDHDNHNITHGHTTLGRTVVLASSLTENSILGAMRLMRFYASEDCSAQVTFKVNNNPLGSQFTSTGAPVITVTSSTSSAVTSLKIYSGVAGSGTNATLLTSSTSGTISYTHTALTDGTSRYYYIDITEADGKRIITAPIWYTRDDTP